LVINRVRLKRNLNQKKNINIQQGREEAIRKTINFCDKIVSPCLPFFPSASPATTYIFIAPTCTTTIITLEPYALNVKFQHFIPRFNKIFSLYGYTERGV
jgi:hypothetical protein